MWIKKILPVVLLFLTLALIPACAPKQTAGFKISGQIKNAPKGNLILSQEEDLNRKTTRVIAAIPVDANGNFSAEFDLEPHIYTLNFFDKKSLQLAIDLGQEILITADGADLTNISVAGSEDTELLRQYEEFRLESLERLVKTVRAEIKNLQEENKPGADSEIERLNELEVVNYDKHRDELIGFVRDKMATSVAVYATSVRWAGDRNVPFLEGLAANFEKKHPSLEITKRLREKVTVLKNTSVGGDSPEIALADLSGLEIKLSDRRGKYTLVDFWASWCSPCRRESRALAGLHHKYQASGFEIYGVSLDDSKDDWRLAIESDGRTWSNVSNLKGFETPATFDYGVTALPANFLIDGKGKIIGKDLHGDDLRDMLEKLLAK